MAEPLRDLPECGAAPEASLAMCEVHFDDYCEVWNETALKARKPHRCSCCGLRVRKGGYYVRHFSIFEGEASTAKICQACWLIREEFNDAHKVMLFPSTVAEHLDECIVTDEDEGEDASRWRRLLKALHRRQAKARRRA
jgi:hypothetical protein